MKTKANPAMKTVYKFVSTGLGLKIQTALFFSTPRLPDRPSPAHRGDSQAAVLFPKALSALTLVQRRSLMARSVTFSV